MGESGLLSNFKAEEILFVLLGATRIPSTLREHHTSIKTIALSAIPNYYSMILAYYIDTMPIL